MCSCELYMNPTAVYMSTYANLETNRAGSLSNVPLSQLEPFTYRIRKQNTTNN